MAHWINVKLSIEVHMRHRSTLALLCLVATLTLFGRDDAFAVTTDPNAEWILSSQLPDGAIAQYPDFTRINPYLGNYVAMGLVRAWAKTGNTAYVDAAERWFA